MRLLIAVLAVIALLIVLVALPLWPRMKERSRHPGDEATQPPTTDHQQPPPPDPEPGESAGAGGRDVPPGSRPDRERHGKP